MQLNLEDVDATERLGAQLAAVSQPGDVFFLIGELGAGKTSLARGFLRHYFADSQLEVPSPSYLLCFAYTDAAASNDGAAGGPSLGRALNVGGSALLPGVSVLHLDPYRLPEGKIASLIDLPAAFKTQVTLIEWPERLGSQLVSATEPGRLEITLGGIGPQACGRAVTLRAVGPRWEGALAEWAATGEVPAAPHRPDAPRPEQEDLHSQDGGGAAAAAVAATRPEGASTEWLVLGIESSCDDTGAAVVRGDGAVLGEVLASQAGVHECWGGVVPKLAQEAHKKAIDATVEEALRRAGVAPAQLSAVAVTVGPGLSLCLEVGVRKALTLCARHKLPLLRVHHMEAHAMVTWLPPPAAAPAAAAPAAAAPAAAAPAVAAPTPASTLSADGRPPFPFLTLLVSGGHNMLVLSRGLGSHTILGSTLDDSIGEAFDKTARLLGISQIPGGPPLERLAKRGDDRGHVLPRPLSKTKDVSLKHSCDFSFSGLKSAVRLLLETTLPPHVREAMGEDELQQKLAHVAASFQRVAVDHLAERTARAIEWAKAELPELSCLVVAGGVAANATVRSRLAHVASEAKLPMVCPAVRLCTDNGIMVAWTGMQRLLLGLAEAPPTAADDVELFVEVRPRWPIGVRDTRSTTQQQQLAKRKGGGGGGGRGGSDGGNGGQAKRAKDSK